MASGSSASARLTPMERDQILRDNFPTVRKGWDPAAVTAHLREIADAGPPSADGGTSLADTAAERVRSVIAAAEETAAQLEREARARAESLESSARSESDSTLREARAEADRLVAAAREEASGRVVQARNAVEDLIAQAGELSSRVGTLGEELAGSIRPSASATDATAEVPGPVIVPEPTPPAIPEPTPDPVPEPTPDPVPEPTPEPSPQPIPDPVPEPTPDPAPDLPDAPEPAPPVPEPAPPPPAASNGVSTDDLIEQLRSASTPANGAPPPPDPGADLGAARLVAMNMTLDGASREEIATELKRGFGEVPDLDGMLDEVFARAGR